MYKVHDLSCLHIILSERWRQIKCGSLTDHLARWRPTFVSKFMNNMTWIIHVHVDSRPLYRAKIPPDCIQQYANFKLSADWQTYIPPTTQLLIVNQLMETFCQVGTISQKSLFAVVSQLLTVCAGQGTMIKYHKY